jgi:hypothetical protein
LLDDPKMPWVTVEYTHADRTVVDWGLYVAETGDRLWIASTVVNSEKRNLVIKPETRLYWIGKNEISAVRMGATTHVDDALWRAYDACRDIADEPDAVCGADPEQRYNASVKEASKPSHLR